jgi:tetratricopeptide (TPR) repeat protein
MNFKLWQIAVGTTLIIGLNSPQIALAKVESNNLHQQEWLVADLATDINDVVINFDTDEKKEWLTNFSTLKTFLAIKDFKAALPIAKEIIRIAEKTQDNTLITFSHFSAMAIYHELGQIQQAIKSCNSAISSTKLVRKSKVMRLMEIPLLVYLGQLYNEQNDSKLALEAFNSASNLLDKVDKNLATLFKPVLLSYMGWAYNTLKIFHVGYS